MEALLGDADHIRGVHDRIDRHYNWLNEMVGGDMTQLLRYSGIAVAGLTVAYFALDIIVWTLYWIVNLI